MTTETENGAAEAVTEETLASDTAQTGEAEGTENTGDDAAAGQDESEGQQQPKPKKSVQERIDEVTRARREAEREAEYWKSKALQAPAQPAPVEQRQEAATEAPPDPAEYAYGEADVDYIADKATYQAEQRFKALLAEQAKAQETRALQDSYAQRQAAFAAKVQDYDQVVIEGGRRGEWVCSNEMADAIKESEVGPEVAYHLAKNPDEARRIAALSPSAQIRAIGRLEAQVSQPAKPAVKTVTNAPEPAPVLRGQGGRFQVQPDTTDFAAFEKAYG